MTTCENARQSTVRADRPARERLRRQKETSFLNAKKSNSSWGSGIIRRLIEVKTLSKVLIISYNALKVVRLIEGSNNLEIE